MLTKKNLVIMAVVLVILVAVSLWQDNRHQESTNRASSDLLVDGEIERSDLERITISFGPDEDVVVLTAGEPVWRLASAWNAKADHNKIDTLLRSISNLRGEFRSDNREVLADYGFTDSTTVRMFGFAADGTEAFAVELGNKAGSGRGGFVKRPGSSKVYLSTADLLGNLGLWSGPERPQSRHFLDLMAYRGDREAVDHLRLEGDETLALQKQYAMVEPAPDDTTGAEPFADFSQWEWRLDDGTMAQKTKGDGVLSAVVGLRAQDVADPDRDLAEYGLAPAQRRLVITPRDGEPVEVLFGIERPLQGKAPAGIYAQVAGDPTVWVLGKFTVDNVFKARADLLPE